MLCSARQLGWPLLLGALAMAAPSHAEEPNQAAQPSAKNKKGGGPQVNLTAQSSSIYNGDNRDTRGADVTRLANDHFGLLNNRLDAQLSTSSLVLSLRLDSFWFVTRPDPTQIALDLVELRRQSAGRDPSGQPPDADYFQQKVLEAGQEMSNRAINWTIPEKLSVSYAPPTKRAAAPRTKFTLGDYYAQFGRGLVLSIRKQDALTSDTTLRGVRGDFSTKYERTRLKLTALAGTGNPLRIDETSGRYLGVSTSGLRGLQHVTEAGMPRSIATDFAPKTNDCATTLTCTYVPDSLFGAQLQVLLPQLKFGTQASLLRRSETLSGDIVRSARRMVTASQNVEAAVLDKQVHLYLEGAGQERGYDQPGARASRAGYALYGTVDGSWGPFSVLIEAKHYRAFYPLLAGVDTARAAQFSQVQYSTVPTTEPIWNTSQFEGFNTCTSGAKTQLDARLPRSIEVFGAIGRWDSWAESVANEQCHTRRDKRNLVWDFASGARLSSGDHRSRGEMMFGVRDDASPANEQGASRVFYREAYSRYDALVHVAGPYSLQFQGWHRYRHQAVGGPENPWVAGQTVTALEVAPLGNIAFGFEYDTNPLTPTTYFNGQFTYRLSSASNISLFIGQRRGALRCVAGVCRLFPSFEGARLDFTLRL